MQKFQVFDPLELARHFGRVGHQQHRHVLGARHLQRDIDVEVPGLADHADGLGARIEEGGEAGVVLRAAPGPPRHAEGDEAAGPEGRRIGEGVTGHTFAPNDLDAIAAAYGLSHTGDLDVLTNLDRAGPPYERTPSELADLQLVTAGGMTVRLNRLQRAGLIERRPNPRDGRGVLVRLTPRGQQLADDALTTLIETQEADIGGLDSSQRDLLAGLLREMLLRLGDAPAFRPQVALEAE